MELNKVAKITAQVEQLKVKRNVAQLSVSGGYYGTSVTTAYTAGASFNTFTTSTYLSGLEFCGKNVKEHKN